MTRTYIIDAEGTRFEAIPARTALRRKIIARTIGAAALIITALFLSAAVIGLNEAVHAPATPSATDMRILHDAQRANPNAHCALEWNETQKGFEAICSPATAPSAWGAPRGTDLRIAKKACARAPKGSLQNCLALYLRGAWYDTNGYTAAGPTLVKDCISQYRGRELADCFTQEIG